MTKKKNRNKNKRALDTNNNRPQKKTKIAPAANVVNPSSRTSSTTLSQLTTTRFADQPIADPIKRALQTVLGSTHTHT